MQPAEATSKGVDTLIARLRDQGVTAGQEEAQRIKTEAEAEAARIIATAKTEAETHLNDARTKAERYQSAGEEALNTAMRDAVLTMKSGLISQFQADVTRMVSKLTADPETLKTMILELVGRARDATGAGKDTEVVLPRAIVGQADIEERPDDVRQGALTEFALGLTQDMLAEGVTLFAESDLHGGIRARTAGDTVELDLSDEAIAALIMQHLQPRFRAVMEGVIR
ncbi:V-type ATP synthase subunit E family protein [Yoonia sp. R2-816]|uniref:V-type ATP synthase subunit E family protein n=1 Tax=Yoonia sp. R2-816 TaxID=3342638 RepID=UPI00372BFA06